jgi:hypothetical protein
MFGFFDLFSGRMLNVEPPILAICLLLICLLPPSNHTHLTYGQKIIDIDRDFSFL